MIRALCDTCKYKEFGMTYRDDIRFEKWCRKGKKYTYGTIMGETTKSVLGVGTMKKHLLIY